MEAQAVRRDKPDSYARYMRANPLYFEGLFRVRFSERNLQKAVRAMFPGRPFEAGRKEIMGSKKAGTCSNCTRGPMTLVVDLCATCSRSAGSLTGEARAKKLAYIKEKIGRGEIKPRGKNAAKLRVEGKAPGGTSSGVMGTGSLQEETGKVEDRFARIVINVSRKDGYVTEIAIETNGMDRLIAAAILSVAARAMGTQAARIKSINKGA
jgi:hypothetical protein